MDFKDYYKILGVEPTADEKAIKAAYRKLARKYHPDVSKERDAEDKFKEANEAYEVLGDAQKRAEFDEIRKYGGQHGRPFQAPPGWQSRGGDGGPGGGFESGDFSDFFSSIFGARGGNPFGGGGRQQQRSAGRRGQDVELELAIFLEETLSKESKQISFQVPQTNAAGQRTGFTTKTLNVKIPAGVTDGERIRLKGQGAPGVGGGANGDLFLTVRMAPHPLFDVEGHDLIITVPLAPWEAALGTKVAVPTLTGKINLTIRPDSQSGQRLRVPGMGLANKNGERGNLYAQLKVVMPPASDPATRELWTQLSEKAAFDPRTQWSK
ncbi:curved DNA-binding protein [Pseudomonas promysalinigenes]|uniref:curved DNA-binding protein n=1 Tax=Pseudomonas TaxID=286 RepID=UPI0016489DF6|nr:MULTISPECIES: curved DNA-binding protein [Pseudomonas]QXI33314.1 curved DNA-binding protein [Pseudomonas promysalinigenes]